MRVIQYDQQMQLKQREVQHSGNKTLLLPRCVWRVKNGPSYSVSKDYMGRRCVVSIVTHYIIARLIKPERALERWWNGRQGVVEAVCFFTFFSFRVLKTCCEKKNSRDLCIPVECFLYIYALRELVDRDLAHSSRPLDLVTLQDISFWIQKETTLCILGRKVHSTVAGQQSLYPYRTLDGQNMYFGRAPATYCALLGQKTGYLYRSMFSLQLTSKT